MSPTEPTGSATDGRPRVAVVGNLCWDVIVRGLPALPGWGEEVAGAGNLQVPGGQGFNLAVTLAALGVPVGLVGVVGDDPAGAAIRAAADARGVDTTAVTVDARAATAVTAALVRSDGERAFASDFGPQCRADLARTLTPRGTAAGAEIVALVGLFNLPGLAPAAAATLLAAARSMGAMTVLDTGWDPLGWPAHRQAEIRALLAAVDVFLPNEDEARALTGLDDPVAAARDLRAAGPQLVVVKRGGAGSVAVDGDGPPSSVGALAITVRDAVGAGDTFDAGFLAARLAGRSLPACLACGAAAAALRISGAADEWPTWAEVEAAAARVPAT